MLEICCYIYIYSELTEQMLKLFYFILFFLFLVIFIRYYYEIYNALLFFIHYLTPESDPWCEAVML